MATIVGTSSGDYLRGTARADAIFGLWGRDSIFGGPGNDTLDGGNGGDFLVGGLGNDVLRGRVGNDVFVIGPTIRKLDAETAVFVDHGRDVISGGIGIDTLLLHDPEYSTEYDPLHDLRHGASDALINLGRGTLRLGNSANRSTLISIENVIADSGDDTVVGSTGANYISAGSGGNRVFAGGGNDTIVGGTFYYTDASLGELLNGGAGNDVIRGAGATLVDDPYGDSATSFDTLVGGSGNDTLVGGAAFQSISGGSGADVIVLTDEIAHEAFRGHRLDFYAPTTISDFDPEEGDVIEFFDFEQPLQWVGLADKGDMAISDVGYQRVGDDTVVRVRMNETTFEDEPLAFLEISLTDFTGPLAAGDFGLG